MILQKCAIFLLACLAVKYSDAKSQVLQLFQDKSCVTTCIVVPDEGGTLKPDCITVGPTLPTEFNYTSLNNSGSLTEKNHENITTDLNLSMQEDKIKALTEDKMYSEQKLILVQYYVKSKDNNAQIFFAGECQIGPEYLEQGYHKLNIQEVTYHSKLWLEVELDDQAMHFQENMNRPIWSDQYESSYIQILGPATVGIPEDSVCNDLLNAMAMTSDDVPYQLAIVASSIMAVLVLLSVVAFLLARHYCRSDFLPIANERASPRRVQDNVAGFDQSYAGSSVSEDFQYQQIGS